MSSENKALGAALRFYRQLRGKTQAQLAHDVGISDSALSEYESGATTLPLDLRNKIVAALGISNSAVERAVLLAKENVATSGFSGWQFSADAWVSTSDTTCAASKVLHEGLLPHKMGKQQPAVQPLLERLTRHPRGMWRALIQEVEEFQTPEFCVLLCGQSEKEAAHHVESSIELAELAIVLAQLADVEERRRSWLLWYTWSYLGNAKRVASALPSAEESFIRSRRALASAKGDPAPLDCSRPLGLEASLRREQHRFDESLSLLRQAFEQAPTGTSQGRVLIKTSKTLETIGDTEGAIAALRQADACLDPDSEPRLRLCVAFNLPVILCDAGRADEAEPLLPRVEELTAKLANRLDLVRLRWLKGKIAAGRGRTEEAIAFLREVRDAFVAENIAYDAGLVTLELAVVYAEQGRTAEVKKLARESAPIFAEQRVERELFATMKLFRQTAERETLTAALARRLLDSLKRGVVS